MRFFSTLSTLSILAVGAVRAASSNWSRSPSPFDTRDLLDVCASIDVDLEVLGIVFGKIDICLCLSVLNSDGSILELGLGAVIEAAVAGVGEAAVVAELEALINGAAASSGCTYPDHGKPICATGTCPFTCVDGFEVSGDQCICPAPSVVCNGVCGPAGSCPSSTSKKRDVAKRWEGTGMCNAKGDGWMSCGVFGNSRAWECVDTDSDLESCGGCALPLTAYQPVGQDCTTLPGVADVSCLMGSCIVHRCAPGYVHNADATGCERANSSPAAPYRHSHSHSHSHASSEAEMIEIEIPAKLYGLEHVTLDK